MVLACAVYHNAFSALKQHDVPLGVICIFIGFPTRLPTCLNFGSFLLICILANQLW